MAKSLLTRNGAKKPKGQKPWWERLLRRDIARLAERETETARARRERLQLRAARQLQRPRPHLKALRLQKLWEVQTRARRVAIIAKRPRDEFGRFA